MFDIPPLQKNSKLYKKRIKKHSGEKIISSFFSFHLPTMCLSLNCFSQSNNYPDLKIADASNQEPHERPEYKLSRSKKSLKSYNTTRDVKLHYASMGVLGCKRGLRMEDIIHSNLFSAAVRGFKVVLCDLYSLKTHQTNAFCKNKHFKMLQYLKNLG